jgi:3-dehydroquinate synthase
MLVMDANVVEPHGAVASQSLRDSGYDVVASTLTADEKKKTLASVESLYRAMLAAKLERRSPVIALGGGIIGDIAGFAAATYLRGVPLINVPTTLLAMIDASIGGKTGVNFPLPESNDLGKNLIGAFWQPRVVLADPAVLLTLQRRDLACGLAECIKHAIIADAALLQWIHDYAGEILTLVVARWEELIVRSVAIKAAIVAQDERESGRRALLNLGHTFAHAIESISDLDIRHGEAVAIGLIAACEVARSLKRMAPDEFTLIHQTITRCDLPSLLVKDCAGAPMREPRALDLDLERACADQLTVDRLMQAMAFDKKVLDGQRRLVLPRGLGAAEVVDDVPEQFVRAAWRDIGARDDRS